MAKVGEALPAPEAGWIRSDDTDPSLRYVGSGWYLGMTNDYSYNKTRSHTTRNDHYLYFYFNGTSLRLIGNYGGYSSKITVNIDGKDYITSQRGDGGVKYCMLFFEVLDLKPGNHKVLVRKSCDESKNITIDCIDTKGGLITNPPPYVGNVVSTPEAFWRRYDNIDSNIIYEGDNWIIQEFSSSYGGTRARVAVPGNSFGFKFMGTKFRLIGQQSSNFSSNVEVNVDGIIVANFPQNIATGLYITLDYELLNLEYGKHTVTITNRDVVNYTFDAVDIDEDGWILSDEAPELTLNQNPLELSKIEKPLMISGTATDADGDVILDILVNNKPLKSISNFSGEFSEQIDMEKLDLKVSEITVRVTDSNQVSVLSAPIYILKMKDSYIIFQKAFKTKDIIIPEDKKDLLYAPKYTGEIISCISYDSGATYEPIEEKVPIISEHSGKACLFIALDETTEITPYGLGWQ